jgi:hypothetical protein
MARLSRSSPTRARAARVSLAAFMDAVVIVDPVQYQRRRDEHDDVSMPLRSLHFGPDEAQGTELVRAPVTDCVELVVDPEDSDRFAVHVDDLPIAVLEVGDLADDDLHVFTPPCDLVGADRGTTGRPSAISARP